MFNKLIPKQPNFSSIVNFAAMKVIFKSISIFPKTVKKEENRFVFIESICCSFLSSFKGTIRYGNHTPIRIGAVFTRVHMRKQACEQGQPFALFFDICEGANPCLNGGTCQSVTPDYDQPSYSQQESSEINYRCLCPDRYSGDHCQDLPSSLSFCINNGTLLTSFDEYNRTIGECLCPGGFRGEHCEENIDDCADIHCSNHGVCQDGIETYTCSCFDGYYGSQCESKTTETVVLQVTSRSFATLAVLLIASIAGLAVASDIHTFLTRKKARTSSRLDKIPRVTSELFENSVLLLAFGDAPIEMSDLSSIDYSRKSTVSTIGTRRPAKKNNKKYGRYHKLGERRYTKTLEKHPSKRSFFSNLSYEALV